MLAVILTTKFDKTDFSWGRIKSTCAITIHSKNETMWLHRKQTLLSKIHHLYYLTFKNTNTP